MSSVALEAYLASLYTDVDAREAFLADPDAATMNTDLSPEELAALRKIDKVGLRMAAASYAHKRENHRKPKPGILRTLRLWMGKH